MPSLVSRFGEVLDLEHFASVGQAEAALAHFAGHYNYHRLSGVQGWLTLAERYDGTALSDRGSEDIPALNHRQGWLEELIDAS